MQLARYWFAIFLPLLIGGLAAIDACPQDPGHHRRRVVAVGLAALICLVYVGPAGPGHAGVPRDSDWRELRAWLSQHDEVELVWTDERTRQTVDFYSRSAFGTPIWDGEFKPLPQPGRSRRPT